MATTLETTYAGLKLRNPIIVGSSGLTNSAEKNRGLYEAGAGAVVLKSLFEEQILMDADNLSNPYMASEGDDYLLSYVRMHKLEEYLTLIRDTKKVCPIPVIASISCYDNSNWVEFARQIEAAGADALEINILALQTAADYKAGSFEQRHIEILHHVKKNVSIPVIMKLGNNITNHIALMEQLKANGAAAAVLFNRFYQPDIDIERMEHTAGSVFSHADEFSNTLRWVGIASASVRRLDIAASGGVHSAESLVKALLAGASAVELCSVIYRKGDGVIEDYSRFLAKWMEGKGFASIKEFRGRLNAGTPEKVNTFERTQFLKYYSSKE